MPQQLSNLEQVLTQRQTPTIGPDDTSLTGKLRNIIYNINNAIQQQPVVKVLQSPFGQVLMGASGEAVVPAINLLNERPVPVGLIMKKAFDGALDDYYDLPAGATRSVREPKNNAVRNIYDQLVARGLARPQSTLDTINNNVQDAKKVWMDAKGINPEEIGPVDARAQMILDHITKSGYTPNSSDLQTIQDTVRNVQRFAPAPSIEGQRTGITDRRLGELARQVAGLLPNKSPLKNAIRNATGWAQYEQPEVFAPGKWVGGAGGGSRRQE